MNEPDLEFKIEEDRILKPILKFFRRGSLNGKGVQGWLQYLNEKIYLQYLMKKRLPPTLQALPCVQASVWLRESFFLRYGFGL